MSSVEPLARIAVGAIAERHKARSAWIDHVWRPVAVLPAPSHLAPWTEIGGDADCVRYYAGAAAIELYPSSTASYRDNLASGAPLLWLVLRPTGREPPYSVAAVTADPGEGEAFNESASDLVEAVPMPELVRQAIAEFIAGHYAERPFVKRKRDRADPQAMARVPAKDRR